MTTLSYTVPVAGSTLNAQADPQIASALTSILAWSAGNIDASNIALAASYLALKPLAIGGSTSAATGILYRATTTLTLTLPAHSAGQVVGVLNSSGTTTVSGTNIQGVGLSSASSFLLGTPGAAVVLVDDGTNWLIVAGRQDTGWVTISLPTNWSALAGFYVPAGRLQGDAVRLRGVATNNTGGSAVFSTTIPAALKPASNAVVATTSGINISSAGGAGSLYATNSTANGNGLALDGATYTVV